MKSLNIKTIGSVIVFSLFSAFVSAETITATSNQVSLSDIHFNPFINCHNTSPCPLIENLRQLPVNQWNTLLGNEAELKAKFSSINQQAKNSNINYVVLLGNFLETDFQKHYQQYASDKTQEGYQSFIKKVMEYLRDEIKQVMTERDVYVALGDKDSYRDDSQTVQPKQFYSDMAGVWSDLIKDVHQHKLMNQQLSLQGYYALDLVKANNLRLIVLNSSLFLMSSTSAANDAAAHVQLDWFQTELDKAKKHHQSVVIVLHDAIESKQTQYASRWNPEYAQRFKRQLQASNSTIQSIITSNEIDEHQIKQSRLINSDDTNQKKQLSSSGQTGNINLMTYNIACLPSKFGIQINGSFLRPNLERVEAITQVINQWNLNKSDITPHLIAFQEAFDSKVRSALKEKLTRYYPYNSGDMGEKLFNAGSGLLLFSQYPIVSLDFHAYTNMMAGEEWLANKGFITAKVKVNEGHYITVILTHLEAGGAIFKEEQSKYGTTSFRRGEQMGYIYKEILETANKAPTDKTFVMGDFNTRLNSERQQKSISTGLSNNGYHEGEIKYLGQFHLFNYLENITPNNFFEVRILPKQKGEGKSVDPALLQQAISLNKFTGSDMLSSDLTVNKNKGTPITRQQSEYNIIDGIFSSHDGVSGHLQTEVLSLNDYSTYPYSMSDHWAIIGRYQFTSPN